MNRKNALKVVGSEKVGGVWNVSNCPNLAGTAAIEVRFSLNFAIVFDFMYFQFRPSKAKWIDDVLTNRQNAANYLQRFFIWSYFVYLPKCCGSGSPPQHCPPLHIWIAASIRKTERYSLHHYTEERRRTRCVNRQGAVQRREKTIDLMTAFRLFGRTLPIHFALLGRKRKYIKSKTTAKLTEKRTSIAAVRDILWTFGTFPDPLLSRYRLPLKVSKFQSTHYNLRLFSNANCLTLL